MELSIIIVNWNSSQYLQACLESISERISDVLYEIIVIDSGSYDGSDQLIQKCFPHVRFVQSDTNLGFARANNQAFLHSTGEFLLFLNPDTQLISDAPEAMLRVLQSFRRAGAVGCTLLNRDGSVQSSSVQRFPTILAQMLNSHVLRRLFAHSKLWGTSCLYAGFSQPTIVEAISGACLMVSRSAFLQVGGFSEEYFMYAEDIDLCHKLSQTGYVNYFTPNALVRHFGGGSSESAASQFSAVMMRESIWRFLRKSRGEAYGRAFRYSTALCALLRLILLVFLLPVQCFRLGPSLAVHSIRNWLAILAWALALKPASQPV